jgi:UDP-N-acetylmuramate: L-alanyl-gamma-D-glutamyl-meso-diaminopimelate ligase
LKFHLIGICGTGMGSLAGLLQLAGHEVRGSDEHVYPPMSTQLAGLGVDVMTGFRAENLDWGPDQVVVGNVCRKDHVEAVAAQARGLVLTSFPAVIEEQFLRTHQAVVVAGTHGKTTCTSLLSWLLFCGGQDPSFLVGGVPVNFERGYRLGAGAPFVVEGDEYDTAFFDKGSKFLHYCPRQVLLTGIEYDHADIFPDLGSLHRTFEKLLALVPRAEGRIVVSTWSPDAVRIAVASGARVEGYAVEDDPDGPEGVVTWRGVVRGRFTDSVDLEIHRGPERWGRIRTTLLGTHNLRNLLGCVALAAGLGIDAETLAQAVLSFRGVKRRQEVRGVAMGVTVIDDFAHHPTAILETLKAIRQWRRRGKLFAAFEPRSATSRRAVFQDDLPGAFLPADEVVIGRPYDQSGIPEADRLDASRVVKDIGRLGKTAHLLDSVEEIVEYLARRARPGDTVVAMSSGAFGQLHRRLLDRIGDAVMPAQTEDVEDLGRLLERTGLDVPDLHRNITDYIVLRDHGAMVGCIGLELLGEAGLLKDIAILPERRGEGLSWLLTDTAVREAARRGVARLFMFAVEHVIQTGRVLGFVPCDCREVEAAVRDLAILNRAWYGQGPCLRLDIVKPAASDDGGGAGR